jgi:hypothetical protein
MLHKALGGHVPAGAMVEALAKLAALGKVRSEMIATGGRPGECWWLVQASPTMPTILASPATEDANERTKRGEPETAHAATNGSFARTQSNEPGRADDISPMALAALFARVGEMGGKIVRSGSDTFEVQGVEDRLSPNILDALVAHRAELDLIVPSPPADPTIDAAPTETPLPVAKPLPRCSCGALVEKCGEMCSSCFEAALAAV